jgi:hypothetical protein
MSAACFCNSIPSTSPSALRSSIWCQNPSVLFLFLAFFLPGVGVAVTLAS